MENQATPCPGRAAASPSCWALLESELELKQPSKCVSQPRPWDQTDLDLRSSWLWHFLAVCRALTFWAFISPPVKWVVTITNCHRFGEA